MRRFVRWFVYADTVIIALFLIVLAVSEKARFMTGGVFVNLGFRMQDGLESFDLEEEHAHSITPEQVWDEVKAQNEMAAGVRKTFPRTARHPLVAMVVCMDARIDTQELVGDTRKYYYVIRTAGSVMGPAEEDMVELAVANGVKVVVLTKHSDCAAEKTAADPAKAVNFPNLTVAVRERDQRIAELLSRPLIAEKMRKGELLVKLMNVDTNTEELLPAPAPAALAGVPAAAPAPDAVPAPAAPAQADPHAH